MRFGIVGPGAMGTFLAAILGRKNDVILLGKKEDDIGDVEVRGESEVMTPVKYTTDPAEMTDRECIIISTKSYDTKKAVLDIDQYLSSEAVVLSLQNGLKNEQIIGKIIGEDRVLGGITSHGVTFIEPGLVKHAGTGKTVIGPYKGSKDAVNTKMTRSIAEEFKNCGLAVDISENIYAHIWRKVIVNSAINPLTALARVKNGDLLKIEELHELLISVGKESFRVAEKDPHLDIEEGKSTLRDYDVENMLAEIEDVAEKTADNRSSMLQDVLNKRRTEIGCINGGIVDIGKKQNVDTPLNRTLFRLIKGMEKRYLS